MGHKIKGRKPECPHTSTKTKTTKSQVATICRDCGKTIHIQARSVNTQVKKHRDKN